MRAIVPSCAALLVALSCGGAGAQTAPAAGSRADKKVEIPAMCVAGAEFAARTKYKNDKLAKAGPKWAEILAVTAPNAEADDAAKAVTTKTLEDISKSFPGSEKDMIDSFARNCGGEGEPEKFAAEHGVQLKPASVQGGQ